ncbi:MAG: succinate dehydrogenase, hydrophobic membrane anchor protein [Roseivivax sp.]|nr:succinate dehydrogenase, hydrophobic membrane anchor protein [Roseivivax sp.]
MRYLTDRKRAAGLGAAKSGTDHLWGMHVSSIGLIILVPLFVFTFGPILGSSYEEVVAYYAHPWPAAIAALTLAVGMIHFKNGAQEAILDYMHGASARLTIILVTCLAYGIAGVGIFSLIRLAL